MPSSLSRARAFDLAATSRPGAISDAKEIAATVGRKAMEPGTDGGFSFSGSLRARDHDPALRYGRHPGVFDPQVLLGHVVADGPGQEPHRHLHELDRDPPARATVALVVVASPLRDEVVSAPVPLKESSSSSALLSSPATTAVGVPWDVVARVPAGGRMPVQELAELSALTPATASGAIRPMEEACSAAAAVSGTATMSVPSLRTCSAMAVTSASRLAEVTSRM